MSLFKGRVSRIVIAVVAVLLVVGLLGGIVAALGSGSKGSGATASKTTIELNKTEQATTPDPKPISGEQDPLPGPVGPVEVTPVYSVAFVLHESCPDVYISFDDGVSEDLLLSGIQDIEEDSEFTLRYSDTDPALVYFVSSNGSYRNFSLDSDGYVLSDGTSRIFHVDETFEDSSFVFNQMCFYTVSCIVSPSIDTEVTICKQRNGYDVSSVSYNAGDNQLYPMYLGYTYTIQYCDQNMYSTYFIDYYSETSELNCDSDGFVLVDGSKDIVPDFFYFYNSYLFLGMEPTYYTVTYHYGDYGTGSLPSSITYLEGIYLYIDFENVPDYNGEGNYSFIGWSETDGDTVATYTSDGNTWFAINSDVELYPVWGLVSGEPTYYTVTYAHGSGNLTSCTLPSPVSVEAGTSYTIHPDNYEYDLDWASFYGWSGDDFIYDDLVDSVYFEGTSITVDSDVTLYPVFTKRSVVLSVYNNSTDPDLIVYGQVGGVISNVADASSFASGVYGQLPSIWDSGCSFKLSASFDPSTVAYLMNYEATDVIALSIDNEGFLLLDGERYWDIDPDYSFYYCVFVGQDPRYSVDVDKETGFDGEFQLLASFLGSSFISYMYLSDGQDSYTLLKGFDYRIRFSTDSLPSEVYVDYNGMMSQLSIDADGYLLDLSSSDTWDYSSLAGAKFYIGFTPALQ